MDRQGDRHRLVGRREKTEGHELHRKGQPAPVPREKGGSIDLQKFFGNFFLHFFSLHFYSSPPSLFEFQGQCGLTFCDGVANRLRDSQRRLRYEVAVQRREEGNQEGDSWDKVEVIMLSKRPGSNSSSSNSNSNSYSSSSSNSNSNSSSNSSSNSNRSSRAS